MINYFTFDGVDSRDFNTFIATSNMFDAPEENVETIHIPYKNTPLHISEKTFKPFILKALCYIPDNMQNNIDELRNFLKSRFASCRYTEALRPGEFRIARFKSAFEVERSDRQTAAFVLTFECAPQRYIIDNPTISLSSTLSEETSYSLSTPAMPLPITLEGNTTQGANPTPEAPQEIHSVKGDNEIRVVGFNVWDEVTANGYYGTNGAFVANASYIAGKNKIPLLPSTQYCITSLKGNLGRICFYNADGTFNSTIINYVGATVTKYTFTTNADVYYMTFDMRSGYGTTYTNDICINVSDTEKNGTYEPYKAQVYPITLPVENLLDINDYSFIYSNMSVANNSIIISSLDGSAASRIYFSRTFASGDYTISLICPNDITPRIWSDKAFSGGTFNSYYNGWFKDFTNYTSVTLAEGSKVGLIFTGTRGVQATITNIQLERGTHANTYNPYGANFIELNALGNYKDYFYKSDGKWYIHKETTLLLFNGTEDWRIWGASQTDVERFVITDNDSRFGNFTLCDKLYYTYGATNYEHFYYSSSSSGEANQFVVYINKSRLSTVDADGFKAWLAQNNLRVVTALQTPMPAEVTDEILISQLNALSKAKTYDGSTTIIQEGADAQFKLSMPVPTEISSEYFGEPIITVSETGTIVWNDSLIKVNSAPVTINSQTLQCYYYSENKNNDVEINEFPKYEQGENYIGSTMDMSVVPNYWKL